VGRIKPWLVDWNRTFVPAEECPESGRHPMAATGASLPWHSPPGEAAAMQTRRTAERGGKRTLDSCADACVAFAVLYFRTHLALAAALIALTASYATAGEVIVPALKFDELLNRRAELDGSAVRFEGCIRTMKTEIMRPSRYLAVTGCGGEAGEIYAGPDRILFPRKWTGERAIISGVFRNTPVEMIHHPVTFTYDAAVEGVKLERVHDDRHQPPQQ
jgi:hypothetical protein